MILKYKETGTLFDVSYRKLHHIVPHLHNALEIVVLDKGTLEVGVGKELYHMEQGDIAIIFPDLIHHYQVFSEGDNMAYYIHISPTLCPAFADRMNNLCPDKPVIYGTQITTEIRNAINGILALDCEEALMAQSYAQIILAKCIPMCEMISKDSVGRDDLVYQTVAYIAAHYREEINLTDMASDLGVSKYVLSRIFSRVFHRNFNQYINDARLNYAVAYLENSNLSITEICMNSGFDSQRTFNRVFKEKYKMSPREYRVRLIDGR